MQSCSLQTSESLCCAIDPKSEPRHHVKATLSPFRGRHRTTTLQLQRHSSTTHSLGPPPPPRRRVATMDLHHALVFLNSTIDEVSTKFRRVPGSSILLRYVKNSYQNDPIRSVVELCLFLFAVRYLLAPRYSTKQKSMDLTEEVSYRTSPTTRSIPETNHSLHKRRLTSWSKNGRRSPL